MKPIHRTFLERTIWGTLLALFLIFIFHYFTDADNDSSLGGIRVILMPLWVILFINLLFNGLLWLDKRLDRSFPWSAGPRKRLMVEIGIAVPITLVLSYINYTYIHNTSGRMFDSLSTQRFMFAYIIIMIVMAVAVSVVIAIGFFRNWRTSLMDMEQLKREKMKTDYMALQTQLNPHFLFNNFNMLLSEIRRNPDNAICITEKLADVYRYVLESKNHETATLRKEAEFAGAILFLHKVRFGGNLVVEQQLADDILDRRLPPLTLQILIENALKHNVISSSHPLHLSIIASGDSLSIQNNIQLRTSTYSTGMGLKNIKLRYEYLTDRKVTVTADDENFTVNVPLLEE